MVFKRVEKMTAAQETLFWHEASKSKLQGTAPVTFRAMRQSKSYTVTVGRPDKAPDTQSQQQEDPDSRSS